MLLCVSDTSGDLATPTRMTFVAFACIVSYCSQCVQAPTPEDALCICDTCITVSKLDSPQQSVGTEKVFWMRGELSSRTKNRSPSVHIFRISMNCMTENLRQSLTHATGFGKMAPSYMLGVRLRVVLPQHWVHEYRLSRFHESSYPCRFLSLHVEWTIIGIKG